MAYNSNFYSNYTFQNAFPPTFNVPPPLPPPPPTHRLNDAELLKTFESKIQQNRQIIKPKAVKISEAHKRLQEVVTVLNSLKNEQELLESKKEDISEEEWKLKFKEINHKQEFLDNSMAQINDAYLMSVKTALAKRAAKRLREKRIRKEWRDTKLKNQREWDEKSRIIDEYLQKIKDNILKAKQAEESQHQADAVLREVLRQKLDARRALAKMEALSRLRRARAAAARARGEPVSECDTRAFDKDIDYLKNLWTNRLSMYNKEEAGLRAELACDRGAPPAAPAAPAAPLLREWRRHLFGGDAPPQRDFRGDVAAFVCVRHEWDKYISKEGSPLPVGWVAP